MRPQRQKKVTELNASSSKAQLTRREREEIEKQKAKAHYQVLAIVIHNRVLVINFS